MNAGPVMSTLVASEHIADAGTGSGCIDTLCAPISVGIANSIFINRAMLGIQEILPDTSRAAVHSAIAGVGASLTNELPRGRTTAVLQAVLDAIKDVWIQMIATTSLSLILSMFMRNEKLGNRLGK